MSQDIPPEQPAERRSELRINEEPMRSVELKLPSLPIYLFKVKDSSQSGFCLLVKEDSNILEHIHVGQILNIRSYSDDNTDSSEILLSEIKHITKIIYHSSLEFNENTIYIIIIFTLTFGLIAQDWRKRKWH